ncbi:hypothetical protein [Amycolatopsis thailandensis]|uniref:hypothetical protein n=1 Tax=Amycolatopsis thailandensis TaxID=589330 RepID=UPI00363DA27A
MQGKPIGTARTGGKFRYLASKEEGLLRALSQVTATSDEMVSPLAALRLRMIQTVPAVRGRALQEQLRAQREIANILRPPSPANSTR